MSLNAEFGVSKRGRRTLIHNNVKYWKHKNNKQGQTLWACTKNRIFKCAARLKTVKEIIIGNSNAELNHSGNLARAWLLIFQITALVQYVITGTLYILPERIHPSRAFVHLKQPPG